MSTARQRESARFNGAKSRGPITVEGKRRSSRNAHKHGLRARTLQATPSELEELTAAINSYSKTFRPRTVQETALILAIATAKIRRAQARAAQTQLWTRTLAAHSGNAGEAFETVSNSNEFNALVRYETTFDRQYWKAVRTLLLLRKQILPNEPDSLPFTGTGATLKISKRTGFPAGQSPHPVRNNTEMGQRFPSTKAFHRPPPEIT